MSHLAVFSSDNTGLSTWENIGSLQRETALYRKFVEHGWDVSFYTYDRNRKLPAIDFEANIYPQWPYVLPKKLGFAYRQVLPFKYLQKGRKADIIITNQAHSASAASLAGKIWRAKVIARCGQVYGESAETLHKSGRRVRKKIIKEKNIFENADKCIIPTKELENWVFHNYNIQREKIAVIPNYVDTELFRPNPDLEKDFDIISIGRLVAKKRHELLLNVMSGTQRKIQIIGNGRLQDKLTHLVRKNQITVEIKPRVEHKLLPANINRSKIYVNLAEWEGHPKALIEAMTCGCACIGAKSPGIENLIINGETGILIEPEPKQIRDTVQTLLGDKALRERLGENARNYAIEHFSLDKVFEQYKKVFEEVLTK
ncbi:glycosyltransferase family 4 protein [Planctomycetota bacterium]